MSNGSFFGVYLLCSESLEKRYRGKCYIGFTVNPKRRIKQHNKGKDFGGAKKTSNKGPWTMIMIVYGFPNNISALQFEWAWQQPSLSSRLKDYPELRRKKPRESAFQYNFRVLNRMLLVGPWNRLPLKIHWLENSFECDFSSDTYPPRIQITKGDLSVLKPLKSKDTVCRLKSTECHLCMQQISVERARIGCLSELCKLSCHIVCLANYMLSNDIRNQGHYVPITGECPLCETELSWAELLQKRHTFLGTTTFDEEDGSLSENDSDGSIDSTNSLEEMAMIAERMEEEVLTLSD